jgi:outer membrane PBP1 activator LpoA protein
MLTMTMTTLYRSSRYLLMIFCLNLVSCTTTNGPGQTTPTQPQTAADWLSLANSAPAPEQAQYRLNAARMLYDQGAIQSSEKALGEISHKYLQGSAVAEYLALRAELVAQQRGPSVAAKWLSSERPMAALNQLQPQERLAAYLVMADLYHAAGDPLKAVNARVTLSPWLSTDAARSDNQDKIWAELLALSPEQIRMQRSTESNAELQGWLELALVAVDNRGDLEQQQARLARWQQSWPNHPARLHPPSDMELLQYLSENPATQIAVLLPLQGRLQSAGDAIRDGIMIAYMDAIARGGQVGTVVFYDTESTSDVQLLYRQAVTDGAELVIGPLAKQKVRRLSQLENLSTPVLALNYIETAPAQETTSAATAGQGKFFQFGLSSKDDAREAAHRAWSLDYRRAFVIHAYDNQSKRTAEAFQHAWDELDGETTATVKFDNEQDASAEINSALHIPLSLQRAEKLGAVTGQALQSSPRRRQDIDFVYLPVSAQQARSIKPLLAFHFAQDLPVLASSRVYAGKLDKQSDSDLNGVYFTETPWVLDALPELSARIDKHIEAGAATSKNLYALGMDAFQMAPRMTLMAYSSAARFSGLTGTLMVSKQGAIIRIPSWAVFRKGIAKPL